MADFGRPYYAANFGVLMRYYYYKFQDDEYELDCLPAYDRATCTYGLYDLVHRQFWGSDYFTDPSI